MRKTSSQQQLNVLFVVTTESPLSPFFSFPTSVKLALAVTLLQVTSCIGAT